MMRDRRKHVARHICLVSMQKLEPPPPPPALSSSPQSPAPPPKYPSPPPPPQYLKALSLPIPFPPLFLVPYSLFKLGSPPIPGFFSVAPPPAQSPSPFSSKLPPLLPLSESPPPPPATM